MDLLLDVKNESIDSTSNDRLEIPTDINSIKQESGCSVQSETCTMESKPQEVERVVPKIEDSSYEMCSYNNIKFTTIKIEYEDPEVQRMKESLDVDDKIKVEACTSKSDSIKNNEPGQTREKLKEIESLLTSDNEGSHESSSSNYQNQLFIQNNKVPTDKNYICSFNKTFEYKSNLNQHLLIHCGTKPFICEICKNSFTHKGHLNRHMLIHNGVKPHSCDVCSKMFRHKSALNEHKLIHSGLRPFSCHLCGKSFTTKTNLVVHKRLHTGAKPYSCDLCKKVFTQKSALITHKRLHTGEKPYSCDKCNKSYADKSNLNAHKKVHKN